MIGYVTLGSNDMAKARDYYDALLGSIGAKRLMEFPDEFGGFTMWGTNWGQPAIAVTTTVMPAGSSSSQSSPDSILIPLPSLPACRAVRSTLVSSTPLTAAETGADIGRLNRV